MEKANRIAHVGKNQTIRFRGFWDDFEPNDFFLPLMHAACPASSWKISKSGPVDLEIVSVLSRSQIWGRLIRHALAKASPQLAHKTLSDERLGLRPSPDARASFWFTGENVRPPLSSWDLMLGFDARSALVDFEYLPLWWLEFPEIVGGQAANNTSRRTSTKVSLHEACQPRNVPQSTRKKFACTFISNPEPMRMYTIQALRSVGDVDVFGPAGGRPVEDKVNIARDYRFVLTLENDIYPDYVTEKVIDGWKTGAIPIWNGIDTYAIFNPEAIVNVNSFRSLDELCKHIERIDRDVKLQSWIAEKPLLLYTPDTSDLITHIHETLRRKLACACSK